MDITRRQFLMLTAATVAAAGCETANHAGIPAVTGERMVNAGPAGNYAADGVYSGFRDLGFFVVRRGDKLFALSAICTHRKCRLTAEPDRSFYCPCHGSTFDPTGHVMAGPARRDLPALPMSVNEKGQLLVTVGS